ncbi:ABC transporter permease [Williamsoniiplasma lucivorax]|uniref:ABC transporter permease n=1 Tax=Williamsoniiplasma lucivorax TaxID=209274 RepID=A0A2S5RD44_9MOLU|nr:ABC transporter permease [Williamsoniiplasma lucivorax]PPE05204.1 ABC transporter permease [Williamsoniiplasma lucivorax]
MKNKSNFLLLLKQGFKGVSKFKAQFVIILILSFLSTLILGVSVSSSRALKASYDNVVGKVDKFDYQGTTEVGSRTSFTNSEIQNVKSMPIVDFNNTDFAYFLSQDKKIQSALNIRLYKRDAHEQDTYITKVTGDEAFKEVWRLSINGNNNEFRVAASWLFANQLFFDMHQLWQAKNNQESTDLTLTYLADTAIWRAFLNNQAEFKFIKNYDQTLYEITKKSIKEGTSKLRELTEGFFTKQNYGKLSIKEREFANYVTFTHTQLGQWIVATLKTFDLPKSPEEKFAFIFGAKLDASKSAAKNNTWTDGKYISNFNAFPNIGVGSIITQDQKDAIDQVTIQHKDNNRGEINDQDIKKQIEDKGFKGMTTPFIVEIIDSPATQLTNNQNPQYQIKNIDFIPGYNSNLFYMANKDDVKSPIFKKIEIFNNFYFLATVPFDKSDGMDAGGNVDVHVRASMMQYHIQINALASGYNANFRKEGIMFDHIYNFKYRVVIQNSFDNKAANFTILSGTEPNADGEVTISEQFAKANNIQLGDYILVGQADVQVVGFATDAFSYFPAADPLFPIPQPKTEAVVYASAKTAAMMRTGDGSASANQDNNAYTFNFFLTPNKNDLTNVALSKTEKLNLFKAFQMDIENSLQVDKNMIQQNGKQTGISYFDPIDFNSSNYRLNWTLLPLALKILNAITYSAAIIIAIIALIAIVINIRKAIHFNAKQIGILKAMGTDPKMISISYLATSLLIFFIVIPLAWIAAMGLQLPFIYIFADYFSIATNQILIDWVSIIISLFVFGLSAIGVSFFTALMMTKKSVVDIFETSVKWTNSKWIDKLKIGKFSKSSFHLRFSLTLTSSGKKPIALLIVVVGMTSFLMSGALAIPSIANNAVNAFYKSVRYSNSYDNLEPIANAPLSKQAINYTQNPEVLDQDWVKADLKLDVQTKKGYGYYKTPDAYSQTISQTSPVPRYLYLNQPTGDATRGHQLISNSNNNGIEYAYEYMLANPGLFLSIAGNVFGDNFFTVLGQTFSIGLVDQFTGLILNSQEDKIRDWLGSEYDDTLSLDANKQKLSFKFSASITNALPNIISAILGSFGNGVGDASGTDWKEKIINVLLKAMPPYVQGFINKSPSRFEQFGVSYNVEQVTPKKETLVTNIKTDTKQFKGLAITGLDKQQDAYVLNPKQQQALFLSEKQIADIDKILNGDKNIPSFKVGDVQVWDQAKNQLTIPMINNNQSQAVYHLKDNPILENVSTTSRQLTYRNKNDNTFKPLPKQAWIYDDSDFVESNLYKNPYGTLVPKDPKPKNDITQAYQKAVQSDLTLIDKKPGQADSRYLDIYKIDNAKFTYNDIYNGDKNLANKAYLFNYFGFDDDHQITSSYLRPYYKYANIKLMIPSEFIDDNFLTMPGTRQDVQPPASESWVKKVDAKCVPDSVKKAWGGYNGQYQIIQPYTLDYKKDHGAGLERLIQGTNSPYWYRYAFERTSQYQGSLWYEDNQKVEYLNKDVTINFQNVGTIASFDAKLLLIDQGVANAIKGYSNGKTYGYTPNYYTSRKGEVIPDDKPRPWDDQLMTFKFKEVKDDIYVDQDHLNQVTYMDDAQENTAYASRQWHTGKLSNIEEPVGITNSASFITSPPVGQYSIGLSSASGFSLITSVSSQFLLSTQKALIQQIYTLAISLGILLIVAIVLTASLLIALVGDIYVTQYKKFMVLMRALGYSNWTIQTYTFGVVSVGSVAVWLLGTVLAWILISAVVFGIARSGFAIPYGFSWWPPLLSFGITTFVFIVSLSVSSNKIRKERVSGLINQSQE